MAIKRTTLAQRLFNITKISTQLHNTNCRVASSSISQHRSPLSTEDPDPGDNGLFRRFLHRGSEISSDRRALPIGENVMEKLRLMDGSRIRLDGLVPPPASAEESEVTVEDVKKMLRLAQLEKVKTRLREMEKSWITYSEFVRVCGECCEDDLESGLGFAKVLDESGFVIVLGKTVFLKPHQVTKAIQSLMPVPEFKFNPNDPRWKELQELEHQKAAIDEKAKSLVRRELWAGLGFLVVQTAGFMRLTFWELSWDVMEPICFYLTSMYFMAGYAFFLRTNKEPSFEGFYDSRIESKQQKLVKSKNFNLPRYMELRKALHLPQSLLHHQQEAPLISDSKKMQKLQSLEQ